MKNIFLIILTLVVYSSNAQTEDLRYQEITDAFVEKYNSNNFEAIFNMWSKDMAKALPKNETKEFLKGLKNAAGNITSREFLKYENLTFASYKTIFEREVFLLNISVDKKSKINGLLVEPYKEIRDSAEVVIHDLSNMDTIISNELSLLIGENILSFPNHTEFAIAIIKNGNPYFYGLKKNRNSIFTIQNQNSIFQIGSITKVFTATLLADLINEGKVHLDDNINQYLDYPLLNDNKITFLSLANHTSGLARLPSNLNLATIDISNPYKNYGEKELTAFLSKKKNIKNYGDYQYSNLGAGLLGFALSKITNQTYDQLLENRIFSRYNMNKSTANSQQTNGHLVKGLDNNGNEVPNWDFAILAGAGAIYSTTQDLSKFAIAQFDTSNEALSLTRETTHIINDTMDIGLGWHIIKDESENHWYWHNGGTSGYTSSIVLDVNTKNGIIILSNVSAYNPKHGNIDDLGFKLLKSLKQN